jgi:hypothetical protein
VLDRAACDRRPIDLSIASERLRLKAYIWADQLERLERFDAATDAALAARVQVETADAVAWVGRRAGPCEGAVTVLFHSIFWQYLTAEAQRALGEMIEAVGATATPTAPFAWLRMEPPLSDMATVELRLMLWPGGTDRLLAHVHPHGAWVQWIG